MTDFFISYTRVDRPWAEWIAWQLEEAGYTTVNQAWDFRPGANFALAMQHAAAESARTIAVLSPAYLHSGFTAAEWATAFARDPTGMQGLLLVLSQVFIDGSLRYDLSLSSTAGSCWIPGSCMC